MVRGCRLRQPPWSLITRVLRKLCSDGARVMLVFHEWPNAPWYPVVIELELRSFLVRSPCYLSPRMYLLPRPHWNTRIAIVDGAAATHRVHRTLGTQPPAKRVRFNHHTAIRPITSCKETAPETLKFKPTTSPPQVVAAITVRIPALVEQSRVHPKEADFHDTLNTDPKTQNRARRFLRKFFQMVTDNLAADWGTCVCRYVYADVRRENILVS